MKFKIRFKKRVSDKLLLLIFEFFALLIALALLITFFFNILNEMPQEQARIDKIKIVIIFYTLLILILLVIIYFTLKIEPQKSWSKKLTDFIARHFKKISGG